MLNWFYLCFFNMKPSGPECLVLWEPTNMLHWVPSSILHWNLYLPASFTYSLRNQNIYFFYTPRIYMHWWDCRDFPKIKLKRHLIVWKMNKKKIYQHERLWGFKYRHFKSWADHVESNIYIYGLPGGASGKEPACQCRRSKRDKGWIPGLGRFPGRGHGNPLQYSCLKNSMDTGVWRSMNHGVTKSQTWLKRLSTQHIYI